MRSIVDQWRESPSFFVQRPNRVAFCFAHFDSVDRDWKEKARRRGARFVCE